MPSIIDKRAASTPEAPGFTERYAADSLRMTLPNEGIDGADGTGNFSHCDPRQPTTGEGFQISGGAVREAVDLKGSRARCSLPRFRFNAPEQRKASSRRRRPTVKSRPPQAGYLIRPRARTASSSSWAALMLCSIPARVRSETSKPSTTTHSPFSAVAGMPKISPSGTP